MRYWFTGWRLIIWFIIAFIAVVYLFSETLTTG